VIFSALPKKSPTQITDYWSFRAPILLGREIFSKLNGTIKLILIELRFLIKLNSKGFESLEFFNCGNGMISMNRVEPTKKEGSSGVLESILQATQIDHSYFHHLGHMSSL
jgi:hypothetical protein